MAVMFSTMIVAGVGLIGGSLALAAKEKGLVGEVVGFGRNEANLRLAKTRGMLDRYFAAPERFPEEADFLVLGTPVGSIVPLAQAFLPRIKKGCLVSDVGSVKAELVGSMERLLKKDAFFVGAHPIAGSEKWGPKAAKADLFRGRRCIVTPTRNTNRGAMKKMCSFWRRIGARVELMDPRIHDRVLGVVSHLPHVVAYNLVNTLDRTRIPNLDLSRYCGGGFRDTTRIASSRPELWRDICLMNRASLIKGIDDYIRGLERLRRWIREGEAENLEKEFTQALTVRNRLG